MAEKFIRVYKKYDIMMIKAHLLIYGDLSANCANCNALDLKLGILQCPHCKTDFKFIAFRNVKHHLPKLISLSEQHPDIVLVDYEDFSRHLGAIKAEEFLK